MWPPYHLWKFIIRVTMHLDSHSDDDIITACVFVRAFFCYTVLFIYLFIYLVETYTKGQTFSRLYWVLLLLSLLFLLFIIYFFFFFDMDHWSDTNKWLIDWLIDWLMLEQILTVPTFRYIIQQQGSLCLTLGAIWSQLITKLSYARCYQWLIC